MKWRNGRKLNEEIANIKLWHEEPDYIDPDLSEEERIERSITRKKLKQNQAK